VGDEGHDFDLGALLRVHPRALQHEPEQGQCERAYVASTSSLSDIVALIAPSPTIRDPS
jgi:hypothetical protein